MGVLDRRCGGDADGGCALEDLPPPPADLQSAEREGPSADREAAEQKGAEAAEVAAEAADDDGRQPPRAMALAQPMLRSVTVVVGWTGTSHTGGAPTLG